MRISIADLPPWAQKQIARKYMDQYGEEMRGKKESKMHNRACEYNGHKFPSHRERDRYIELLAMQRAGEIDNLRMQVPYMLHAPSETTVNGKKIKRRGMKYIADFVYVDRRSGREVIEDAK